MWCCEQCRLLQRPRRDSRCAACGAHLVNPATHVPLREQLAKIGDGPDHRSNHIGLLWFVGLLWIAPPLGFSLILSPFENTDTINLVGILGWWVIAAVITHRLIRQERKPTHRMAPSEHAPELAVPTAAPVVEGVVAPPSAAGSTNPLARSFAIRQGNKVVIRGGGSIDGFVVDTANKRWRLHGPVVIHGRATTRPVISGGTEFGLPYWLQLEGDLHEWLVRPGDRLRVWGYRDVEADPHGAATYRETPTIDVVRGSPDAPIIIELL